jgi:hypothetical protein
MLEPERDLASVVWVTCEGNELLLERVTSVNHFMLQHRIKEGVAISVDCQPELGCKLKQMLA